MTYEKAGVNIEKGDEFAGFIRGIDSPAVALGTGGFAEGVEIPSGKYRHPVILAGTDGVGTKLLVAKETGRYDTVGIDLVAMCVNDLLVCGAEPVSFLDYIACGRIEESVLQDIIKGIVEGCSRAGCVLSGGETAEMPDMYGPDEFDLAGFCWGIVERDERLPRTERVRQGDTIIGFASSGIHSNGFSLARKVLSLDDPEIRSELLIPTRIYAKEMEFLMSTGCVSAAAHITGGGLEGNLSRVLPEPMRPVLRWDWEIPTIFTTIQGCGTISDAEMRRVFNMGIGLAAVISRDSVEKFHSMTDDAGIAVMDIGEVR